MSFQPANLAYSLRRLGIRRLFCGTLFAFVALCPLVGCKQDSTPALSEYTKKEYGETHASESELKPFIDVTRNQALPIPTPATPGLPDVSQGMPNPRDLSPNQLRATPTGFRSADADYVEKADLYWSLNWIRKQLLMGSLPHDLPAMIAKLKKSALKTAPDKNYQVTMDAITYLESGLQHLKAIQALMAVQVEPAMLPWSSGETGLKQYIEENRLGFGGKTFEVVRRRQHTAISSSAIPMTKAKRESRDSGMLSPEQQRAIGIILEYGRRYRANPEELMQREWKQAIQKINDLRDNLGLMNRAENRDGDSTFVPPNIAKSVMGAGPAMPSNPAEGLDSTDRPDNFGLSDNFISPYGKGD